MSARPPRPPTLFENSFGRLMLRKSVNQLVQDGARGDLKRTLGPVGLTLLGLGAIIGTGIFVLTGVAAKNYSGNMIWFSYVIAGLVSALAALCYAELGSMIPVSGSAYTYAYAGIGEIMAWIIAWDLILEYAVGAMTVAVGWAGYVGGLVASLGYPIPAEFAGGPLEGGTINVLAVGIVLVVTALLVKGIQESASTTNLLVVVKVIVILFVITLGLSLASPTDFFLPHPQKGGFGVITGAGLVFFAYIGFDALSTTAEETRNPKRDLPIGIIASLSISTLLYIAAAIVLVSLVPLSGIVEDEPFAAAFRDSGYGWAGDLIAAGAVAGITSVLIVLLLSQPRVFFSMARDGLLPRFIGKVHPRFKTPYVATIITGLVVAVVAGIMPIRIVGEVTNIGTLFAFLLVCLSVIILRRTDPDAARGFRVPGPVWLIPGLGVLGAFALMLSLPLLTWLVFLTWFGLGLVLYAAYGYNKSKVQHAAAAKAAAAESGAPYAAK